MPTCQPTKAPVGQPVGGCGALLVSIPGGAGGYVCPICDGPAAGSILIKGDS